ncbi:hypothetical protein GCK72_014956 [Caenorhabditis remanei]|uniref:Uncharacterized protein n=1 Tax=Caenorhabditis remanei TaxID=31234 RepID=A0A6A5GSP6_CAERE|nr:hypothetical protein GCK72_014956 [Caenorhabditis remanei]KAF1758498.1 hypothetical protein GCK72_014956 [Caenorhabditis remanei]
MLRFLLLLFSLFSFGSTIDDPWDHFEFAITFHCYDKGRSEYNLVIEWWEDDALPKMEQITQSKFIRAKTGNFSFSMAGAMDGDEPWSNGYSPVAYITHDCERYAQPIELEMHVNTQCKVGQKSCYYRIIQDITSQEGKKYVNADALKMGDLTPFPDFHEDL